MSPTRHCISDQQYETRTVEQILATATGQGVQNESDWRRVLSLILQKERRESFTALQISLTFRQILTVNCLSHSLAFRLNIVPNVKQSVCMLLVISVKTITENIRYDV
jgi:hypothetical protein